MTLFQLRRACENKSRLLRLATSLNFNRTSYLILNDLLSRKAGCNFDYAPAAEGSEFINKKETWLMFALLHASFTTVSSK